MKTKYLGIGYLDHLKSWYSCYLFLWNRCIWITLWGKGVKRPTYVYWNKKEFDNAIKYDLFRNKFFIGLTKR